MSNKHQKELNISKSAFSSQLVNVPSHPQQRFFCKSPNQVIDKSLFLEGIFVQTVHPSPHLLQPNKFFYPFCRFRNLSHQFCEFYFGGVQNHANWKLAFDSCPFGIIESCRFQKRLKISWGRKRYRNRLSFSSNPAVNHQVTRGKQLSSLSR